MLFATSGAAILRLSLGLASFPDTSAYPVSEWLAPRDYQTLDIAQTGWSGTVFRNRYVGRGETDASWSRQITTWSAPGDMFGAGPVAVQAATARTDVIADCPGARSGALRLFTWSGRPAAEFWISCRLLPATSRPDHYLVRMISGETQLLSAAISFRAPPTSAQIASARAYLDTLALCAEPMADPACRNVPAPPATVAPAAR